MRIKRSACSAPFARHQYFCMYYYLSQISLISQIFMEVFICASKDLRALRYLRDTYISACIIIFRRFRRFRRFLWRYLICVSKDLRYLRHLRET